jgi:hypothetical protein
MAKAGERRREMEEWFRRRDREGWSLRELAGRAGMPAGTVSWWAHELSRQKREHEMCDASGFRLLVAADAAYATRADGADPIRIRLGNGTEIALGRGVDAQDLARVLDALEGRC